jgi:hypothetical protein
LVGTDGLPIGSALKTTMTERVAAVATCGQKRSLKAGFFPQHSSLSAMAPDLKKVQKWQSYFDHSSSNVEGAAEAIRFHNEARSFLESFTWCSSVIEAYIGFSYAGIVAVFLFQIAPARAGVDEWVWVVVGDIPPAYITCEESPNPACALDAYIGAMDEWVQAASFGRPTKGLIPVNVAPSKENAERLRTRLQFLDKNILAEHSEDLDSA